MKKWTGILLSLLVLLLLTYAIMGFIVKNTLNENINSIPQNSIVAIKLNDYQRGWFSSHAVLSVKMHIPAQESKDEHGVAKIQPPVNFELNYPLIIKHGPVICMDSGIHLGIGYATTQPQTHYYVLVNFFNETWARYAFPSFTFRGNSGPDAVDFSWQGLSATLGTSPSLNNMQGDLILYGLSGSANNAAFQLGKVADAFNLARARDGLWLGKNHFSLLSLSMTQGGQKLFALDGVDLASSSDATAGLFHVDLNLSMKKLFADNKTYGPGSVQVAIRNLDADAMASINQRSWSAIQNNQSSPLLVAELLSNVPKLLSKGAELDLSGEVNLPEGKMTTNFKLTLPQTDVSDPAQLLQKAQGSGQFKAPIPVVKELMAALLKNNKQQQATASVTQTSTTATSLPAISTVTNTTTTPDDESQKQVDKILSGLLEKGYIKVDGNNYVVDLKIENQKIFMNGKLFGAAS